MTLENHPNGPTPGPTAEPAPGPLPHPRRGPLPPRVPRAGEITMPLFFASNALYPVAVMPGWLLAVSKVNPLSCQADALRGLLLGTPARLAADSGVLVTAAALGVAAGSSPLGRPAR